MAIAFFLFEAPTIPVFEAVPFDHNKIYFYTIDNGHFYDSITITVNPSNGKVLTSSEGTIDGLSPATVYIVTVVVEIGSKTDCGSSSPNTLTATNFINVTTCKFSAAIW